MHTHAHAHAHAHTHTHTHAHEKFKFFNENIRSNKDSEQTERNELKNLHYLSKMIKKNPWWKSSFLEKFHASSQNYFKGFV